MTSDGTAPAAAGGTGGDPADGAKARAPFVTPQMVAIEAELTAKRAALASTVDELAERLDPRHQAARLLEGSRQLLHDAVDPDASPEDRRRVLTVVGGVVVGLAALAGIVWLRRR